ncbi:type II toxin-antitoxin system RelE/ParE family toxin [Mesorhizobium sp. ORM8.1]
MIKRLAVVLSEGAISDLEAIGAYVLKSSGSENIANGFVDRIKQRCQSIGNYPSWRPLRDDIASGLRIVPFEHSAVIAYVIADDLVDIVSVFYGGRDYEALIRGSGEPS